MKKYIYEHFVDNNNGEAIFQTTIINKTIFNKILKNINKYGYHEGHMEDLLIDEAIKDYLKLSRKIDFKDIKFVEYTCTDNTIKSEYSRYNKVYILEII